MKDRKHDPDRDFRKSLHRALDRILDHGSDPAGNSPWHIAVNALIQAAYMIELQKASRKGGAR
jgi:hypothetical protein